MSDIFDEVDDILNEVNGELSASEMTEAAEVEKNFNESELLDIMAEIEGLENEGQEEREADELEASEPAVASTPPIVTVKKTELQSEIDRELEMSLIEKEEEELDQIAPKILSFDKKPTAPIAQTTSSVPSSEISFEAHGQMNLNLGFKIGEENAKLTIDPTRGLVVSMSGVELRINHEDGCIVTMENGVKFTIPLTSSESNLKKKSA